MLGGKPAAGLPRDHPAAAAAGALPPAGLLVFLFCFTSFGVILILGGPRFATLEVEIYRQAVNLFRLPEAAALSLAQIGLTFIVMVGLHTRPGARLTVPLNLRAAGETAQAPATRGQANR